MAIKFGNIEGKAKKSSVEAYAYKDGDNKIRMVGDVLPRYVYWLTTADGKRVPMECLGFDRDKEQFTNIEKDWIRHYFPDLKCSWAYAVQCIDSDGKVKILNLKKKLFNYSPFSSFSAYNAPCKMIIRCERFYIGLLIFISSLSFKSAINSLPVTS